MKLIEIKIKALSKGLNMTQLAKELKINRRVMYKKISENDKEFLDKLKNFFNS